MKKMFYDVTDFATMQVEIERKYVSLNTSNGGIRDRFQVLRSSRPRSCLEAPRLLDLEDKNSLGLRPWLHDIVNKTFAKMF